MLGGPIGDKYILKIFFLWYNFSYTSLYGKIQSRDNFNKVFWINLVVYPVENQGLRSLKS